jgi:hypothetical protein
MVTKASGVFLWVILIVRSLLSGLRSRDDIAVLRKRLRDLPADLSSLYTHMLNHVEPLYNEQASQAFRIYGAISKEKGIDTNALEFQLAIAATPHNPSSLMTPMTDEEVKTRCEDLDVHLKSRCAGSLEIHTGETTRPGRPWGAPIKCFDVVKPTQKVNYLHRTVKGFLETEDVRTKLLNDGTADFDPHTFVIHSCVSRLYRSVFLTHLGFFCPPNNEEVWGMIVRAKKYGMKADASGGLSNIATLDNLARAGRYAWRFDLDPWKGKDQIHIFQKNTTVPWRECDKTLVWTRNFVGEAIIHKLFAYIKAQLRGNHSLLLNRNDMPLLFYAFDPNDRYFLPPSPEIVGLLLQEGADPNQ